MISLNGEQLTAACCKIIGKSPATVFYKTDINDRDWHFLGPLLCKLMLAEWRFVPSAISYREEDPQAFDVWSPLSVLLGDFETLPDAIISAALAHLESLDQVPVTKSPRASNATDIPVAIDSEDEEPTSSDLRARIDAHRRQVPQYNEPE